MGNCVIYVSKTTVLPGGEKLVRGKANPTSSYAAGGEGLNLSNFLLSTGSPTVVCSGADGYVCEHDQGTATAGKLVMYQNLLNTDTVNGVAANTALYQCHTGLDVSGVNVVFCAIGKAY